MQSNGKRRALAWLAAAMLLCVGMSPPVMALEALPERIWLCAGEDREISFSLPDCVEISGAAEAASSGADVKLGEGNRTLRLTADSGGADEALVFRLLGWLPLKRVDVSVERNAERRLIPGGQSVGVALLTEGVVVVGASDLGTRPSPARVAGLRAGDRIVSINGRTVENAAQLTEMIQAEQPCMLKVVRDDKPIFVEITPAMDRRDGVCRLGMWVRDSTAGIGTLSFYDPDTDTFGALGHAVTDADTGLILPVSTGGIYKSSVTEINKGRKGAPGELMGQFYDEGAQLGDILLNTGCGIFGKTTERLTNPLYPDGLPVASAQEVRPGPAELLTTLRDGRITAFACEIEHVDAENMATSRSLLVRITDPALLEQTGGIVQGMSGSPLIQAGKLVGAVTHVLVNDPTRGYGIFLENMLEASQGGET